MEQISIFDIYKIGVGPSSSHTLGPWKAALDFADQLQSLDYNKVDVLLYGSLSKTGKGHGTDVAVQLGLSGHDPKTIPTERINGYLSEIADQNVLYINGKAVVFTPGQNIRFENFVDLEHPNTVIFKAYKDIEEVCCCTYYSVGGGFIEKKGEFTEDKRMVTLPYPINTGEDLLRHTAAQGCSISEIVRQNELVFGDKKSIDSKVETIYNTMLECVYKGCNNEGILPGGLNVKRRAKKIASQLLDGKTFDNDGDWIKAIQNSELNFTDVNKWISCFALAVNEENAALGRVVTSPTNGAAGVIPAVLLYYYCFCDFKGIDDLHRYLYTSGEIGCIFKKGATISAAVGGCQAEIGVSSAMAAGGLTEVMGGSPEQVLMAAEIAMEHHLGLTCDPIGGLVQIPCIERNTMGAMKAITASNLAMSSDPKDALVNLDLIVKTMWDTAQDMNGKYKETAEGGLAFNLPVILPEC